MNACDERTHELKLSEFSLIAFHLKLKPCFFCLPESTTFRFFKKGSDMDSFYKLDINTFCFYKFSLTFFLIRSPPFFVRPGVPGPTCLIQHMLDRVKSG